MPWVRIPRHSESLAFSRIEPALFYCAGKRCSRLRNISCPCRRPVSFQASRLSWNGREITRAAQQKTLADQVSRQSLGQSHGEFERLSGLLPFENGPTRHQFRSRRLPIDRHGITLHCEFRAIPAGLRIVPATPDRCEIVQDGSVDGRLAQHSPPRTHSPMPVRDT